jgi:DNA-binding CsgD family transcriptional regulator
MTEHRPEARLTGEEKDLIVILRQGPYSVDELAQALRMSRDHVRTLLRTLDEKVGLVSLSRYTERCYGLAE